jgi:hypothetical protein
MKLAFPSREFDEAVAAICHGSASDEQAQALNELLRTQAAARDEYLLRLELHARLASEPDLFVSLEARSADFQSTVSRISNPRAIENPDVSDLAGVLPNRIRRHSRLGICVTPPGVVRQKQALAWAVAIAACLALLAAGWWALQLRPSAGRKGTTSKAVAMLNRAVDAQWNQRGPIPRLSAPLEPGWLRLKSGLAQIVFYSGTRVVIEGPAEFQILSPNEASCRGGRLTAEVPPQAQGFRIGTPHLDVTDLGTSFGLEVKNRRTDLHVFKGSVTFQPTAGTARQNLQAGAAAVVESSRAPRLITANPAAFASLFNLQAKSVAAEALRYDQWRAAGERLNGDPSLIVRFDFENLARSDWRLYNMGNPSAGVPDATIVGCQRIEGRWPDKPALEFQNVSDRVRLNVAGEFEALTFAAWVRVQGLDRTFNSLFMTDGFEPGEVHWLIRNDGVLSFAVKGPGSGNFQIVASPSVLTLDRLGLWTHLAVVLDGKSKRAVHYVNGLPVSENPLKLEPPFRIGAAELGNWNTSDFPDDDPFLIRNFSGAMDEFCLFSRALDSEEIRALYSEGKPLPDPVAP